MTIKDEYYIYYGEKRIGTLYVFTGGRIEYSAYGSQEGLEAELAELGLDRDIESGRKKDAPALFGIMDDGHRVKGTRKHAWQSGSLRIERIPKDEDRFMVYRISAEKGEPGYSEKRHSAPHREGAKEIEGMDEWASWYCFNRKDDGMFEAELDEAWWWGGSHNDGGTIRTEVPEEWLSLPYDEFLERVVTLSAAAHYGFTADDLREKEGLREFFGF